ncbi:ABC transporter ATP-binding protein [Paenibacillus radicis (ex Xue et al. 2023)]|uniref:ABC transporter ATP-binding protein/permease n=1 Tax=Paenibacillus radicis (ex Xue et al. 2023) TaxID=2972489 RepID=A0ABT1YCR3_9BACL|nr:ABC transporter ATP-binding protein [Paenibacillus radicis (ex Xue et al. 2023)]MCR8629745.1 ABC transporter ATP-binding protein/permease [Paenibacillus radicis (ex Xue et al. 2023)]
MDGVSFIHTRYNYGEDDFKLTNNNPSGGWRDFVRLIWQTKPPLLLMSIALAMSIGSTLVGLSIPLFTKNMVNSFSLDSIDTIHIIGLGAAFIMQAIAGGISVYLLNRSGQKVVASLRDLLWKKHLQLPIPFYDRHQTGEMVSRIVNDTGILKELITENLTSFVTGLISIIGAIGVLLYLDWRMTLLIVLAVPLSMLFLFPLGRKMHQISKGLQGETAQFTATLTRVLSEIRLVKTSNAEHVEYANGQRGITNLFQFGVREGKVQAVVGPLMYFVIMLLFVVIIGYGGLRVSSGELTSGDLVAFLLYLFQIIMPITQISRFFTQFQKGMGATERIIATLATEEEDLQSGRPVADMGPQIKLEQVSFAYPSGDQVLKDVNITIEMGKVTAIVGPSGGGKTTLFSMLERFYEPQDGLIRIGGEALTSLSLSSWRSRIGYVSQESPLIAGTIRDNITYGMEQAISDEQLAEAARMAYADVFINELPNRFDTEVGERGIKLSGGQRQRIAIARALLRNPSVLMLDEATSSLDSLSEIMVQKALKNLMKGRTTLVIAHRLSTVVDADQIVFIEKGKVTGNGTHNHLYETHSMYREFADQQLRMQSPV